MRRGSDGRGGAGTDVQLQPQEHTEPRILVPFSVEPEGARKERVAGHRDVEGDDPAHGIGHERARVERLEVHEEARGDVDLCDGCRSRPGDLSVSGGLGDARGRRIHRADRGGETSVACGCESSRLWVLSEST